MQLKFSKHSLLAPGLLLLAIGLFYGFVRQLPDRRPQPPATTIVHFAPVALDPAGFAGTRLFGAWRMTAADRRFGGLSALAVERGGLLALSDSGAVVRLALPLRQSTIATIAELPDGPGSPRWKKNRDSEALAGARTGGWWVAFENGHQLWRFDAALRRPIARLLLGADRWPANRGVEAMAMTADGTLLLLPEDGRSLIALRGRRMIAAPIAGAGRWRISDAALLPDGRLLVLRRRVTPGGLRSSLAELVPAAGGYRYRRALELGLGPLDNPEGMAAQRLTGGRVRLWLVADDDFRWPMRSLLLALDLPAHSRL